MGTALATFQDEYRTAKLKSHQYALTTDTLRILDILILGELKYHLSPHPLIETTNTEFGSGLFFIIFYNLFVTCTI